MLDWKENAEISIKNHYSWWKGNGMVISSWEQGYPLPPELWRGIPKPAIGDLKAKFIDPETVAARERYELSKLGFPLDILPFAHSDWGTVTAAPFFGSQMIFGEDTLWYKPSGLSPENDRELILEDQNPWYLNLQDLVRTGKDIAGDDYFCGMPALSPGLDVLAELCGASELCIYLISHPGWVHEKLEEINTACIKAYNTIYDIAAHEDGSVFVSSFRLWAPGKVTMIQNDFSSLISETMFREFAVPFIKDFASAMEFSLFHIDGPEALRTVDALIEIDELTSLEFTPGPQVPGGGDPHWYDMYRKILAAGKGMQVVWMKADEVVPLIDAVGPDGLYLMVEFKSLQEAEDLAKDVEPY